MVYYDTHNWSAYCQQELVRTTACGYYTMMNVSLSFASIKKRSVKQQNEGFLVQFTVK